MLLWLSSLLEVEMKFGMLLVWRSEMDGWMGRIAVVFGRVGYIEASLVVVVVV